MKDTSPIYVVCHICGRLLAHNGPDKTGGIEVYPCPDCIQEAVDIAQEGRENV